MVGPRRWVIGFGVDIQVFARITLLRRVMGCGWEKLL